MKLINPIVAAVAVLAVSTSAFATDLSARHRRVFVAEPALTVVRPVEPVIVAVPGVAVTTYPWLTQSYNPFTDPVNFALQFVPRVHVAR